MKIMGLGLNTDLRLGHGYICCRTIFFLFLFFGQKLDLKIDNA
jgi:hypothetical protein